MAKKVSAAKSEDHPIHVRVTADHQLFSDITAAKWYPMMLSLGVDTQEIENYEVVHTSYKSPWGLQYAVFTADMWVSPGSEEAVKKGVTKRLNRVICDTDVDVRWIAQITD